MSLQLAVDKLLEKYSEGDPGWWWVFYGKKFRERLSHISQKANLKSNSIRAIMLFMQVNNHTATPPRPARAIRQWNGQEFEITLSWEPDSTINENLEFELKADENKQNVGTLKGFVCNGDRFLKVENADAVCREGGEVVADLIHRFPMLAEDSIDLVFLYKLQAEGKGRRIGQMLIREVAQTLPTLSPNYSLLCWYASPLTANKTEDLADRLIQYYRQLPAINPGKDKQMMLWDPNEVSPSSGIEIRDRGARPGLLKKRGGRHSYYAVFYSGNDRISNTMLNSQIAAQKLTEMCRQALDTTARDMLEKHSHRGR